MNEEINAILADEQTDEVIITKLKEKSIFVPDWGKLRKEYDPREHQVMDESIYPDIIEDGRIEPVTRVTRSLQKLAVNRMAGLCFGIPVNRKYHPKSDAEIKASEVIEKIYLKNRINAMNMERGKMYFASCEVATLWYAVEEDNTHYGVKSPIKIRTRSYSPMNGCKLYPLFDENDDYIALSIAYDKVKSGIVTHYFDTYTTDRHIQWKQVTVWERTIDEPIRMAKNPTLYMHRNEPIWEDKTTTVSESEWAMSRNGNYIRKNSRPVFVLSADEETGPDKEDNELNSFKNVLQIPMGSKASYVTWEQATDSLKLHLEKLDQSFFTDLQLPDISFAKMKEIPLSGEARKQMFIDSILKVTTEAGRLGEFFDREMNVVKAWAKIIVPSLKVAIDSLEVENVITPFAISELTDMVNTLTTAVGGKAIMSLREAVEKLGISTDPDNTIKAIKADDIEDVLMQ